MIENSLTPPNRTIAQKLWQIPWFFVFLLCVVSGVGVAMLYSAANGNMEPWALQHMVRFAVSLLLMLIIAMIDVRVWMRYSYALYFFTLMLLGLVEFFGSIGMGAQRWISLGYFSLQPSELMKVTMVLALARYFHSGSLEDYSRIQFLVLPLMLVIAPVLLVLRQPDLGTAIMLILASGAIFFVVGVKIWKFLVVIIGGFSVMPILWQFLHSYQKQRVLTFLNPERDPLGSGYHIIQSKIALGSGGLSGKGFLEGTQGHLRFLPEMQTDFIFTMLAEEFGLLGGVGLVFLYALLILYGVVLSLGSRSQFGRLVGAGVTATFFLYVFINIAMVMGLIPIVGAPLPLISYGGTAMLTVLIGFGFLLSVWNHRDIIISQRGGNEY